jgi:hypothetical protein
MPKLSLFRSDYAPAPSGLPAFTGNRIRSPSLTRVDVGARPGHDDEAA